MGVSTDAKLVWGFNVEEGTDEAAALDEFMDAKYDALRKAEKAGGELVYHQHGDCQAYIVGLKATYTCASRGNPEEIKSLDLPPDAQAQLDAFAKALGLDPQPGKWLLASYWG